MINHISVDTQLSLIQNDLDMKDIFLIFMCNVVAIQIFAYK